MKKIKSVKHEVKLSYRNSFVFDTIEEACTFMKMAVRHAEDPEDIASFEISPIVEFEEEVEPIYCDTDRLTEADKIKMKQLLNEKYGRACADEEEETKGGDKDV